MIVVIGNAKENSVSIKLARKLASLNAPVSFLGPFSQDDEHNRLLESLIDDCILFDPVFCNTSGRLEDITYERLSTAFSVNSDIEKVYAEDVCRKNPVILNAIERAMGLVNAKLEFIAQNDDIEALASCAAGAHFR